MLERQEISFESYSRLVSIGSLFSLSRLDCMYNLFIDQSVKGGVRVGSITYYIIIVFFFLRRLFCKVMIESIILYLNYFLFTFVGFCLLPPLDAVRRQSIMISCDSATRSSSSSAAAIAAAARAAVPRRRPNWRYRRRFGAKLLVGRRGQSLLLHYFIIYQSGRAFCAKENNHWTAMIASFDRRMSMRWNGECEGAALNINVFSERRHLIWIEFRLETCS